MVQLPGGAPLTIRPPEVIICDIIDGQVRSFGGAKADIWALASPCKESRTLAMLLRGTY